jgi:amidohydrolase
MRSRMAITLALFLSLSAGQAFCQSSALTPELVDEITSQIDADSDRLTEIFKDIHSNPELGFMEVRTAGIVAKELETLGYVVKTGIGKTGVVGIMENGEGPIVMYRADMDANAVEEATGLPYESKVRVTLEDGTETPVAHMCGHDAHVTWLISVARTMATLKDRWNGTLILVGQPAEELVEGAAAMVSDGLFEKHGVPVPNYLLGLHTAPIPTGIVIGSGGTLMAGTEQLDVIFKGVGGHGSSPQYTKDPILMGAYAITQYQAILSRVLDPRDPAVISVGAFNSGLTNNVIPGEAELKLNFRFFREEVREQLLSGVRSVSNGIARTYGMPEDKLPTIVQKGYATPLVNDYALVERMNHALLQSGVVSEDNLSSEFKPVTGSEDVQMLVHGKESVKIAYKIIGTAPPDMVAKARKEGKQAPFWNHQPTYIVDLDAIPFGAKVGAIMVMDLMASE